MKQNKGIGGAYCLNVTGNNETEKIYAFPIDANIAFKENVGQLREEIHKSAEHRFNIGDSSMQSLMCATTYMAYFRITGSIKKNIKVTNSDELKYYASRIRLNSAEFIFEN